MEPTSLNTYTIIGLHPDTNWSDGLRAATFVHVVRAGTPTLAAREAKRQITGGGSDPDDIMIIAVFEGRHRDHYEPSLDTEEYEHEYEREMSQ